MGLNKIHPQHLINMALFTLNCLKTDDKGNTAAHRHWAPFPGPTRLPLVTWKDVITGKCQSPAPQLTIGKGFPCVSPENGLQPIRIHSLLTRPWIAEASKEADEIEQLQETAASICPAHVFTYCTD